MDYIRIQAHEDSLNGGLTLLMQTADPERKLLISKLIVDEIAQWLPTLWRAMFFDYQGKRFALIRHALFLCTSTLTKLHDFGGERCRYTAFEASRAVNITYYISESPKASSSERKRYKERRHVRVFFQYRGTIEYPLTWIWREFLMLSQLRERPTQVILDLLHRFGLHENVKTLMPVSDAMRDEMQFECTLNNKLVDFGRLRPDGVPYFDKHWKDDMKMAAETVAIRMGANISELVSSDTETSEDDWQDDQFADEWMDLEDRYL